MPKKGFLPGVSKRRGHVERLALAGSIRSARLRDLGIGGLPYNTNRRLQNAPFAASLQGEILARLGSGKGKVRVLDKGAGSGLMLSDIKRLAPKRVDATAVSLSKTMVPASRRFLDNIVQGIGLNMKHGQKFDVIYDCYGEDYYLAKSLSGKSIAKAFQGLKKGGVLFTVIPLLYRRHGHSFSVEEGHAFLRRLRKSFPKAKVSAEELPKRFDSHEYIDLVLEIRKP